MPEARTLEEAEKEYHSYSGYKEKIAEYGLIAMEITDPPRERAGSLVLRDGKVLLVHRKNGRGEYYVVPGGGVEEGETPQAAAIREMEEEAELPINVGLLLCERFDEEVNQHQYFFLADIADDLEFVISSVKWQEKEKQRPDNSYRLEWVSLADVEKIDLKPEELKLHLGRLK